MLPTASCWADSSDTQDREHPDAIEREISLRVVSLRGSVPQEWPLHWRQAVSGKSRLMLERRAQLANIFDDLDLRARSGRAATKAAATADAVTLGDAWLGPAIKQGLIQPIPHALSSRWWRMLGPRWHSLVRRDDSGQLAAKGQVWGAPYRWGCTLIAVHTAQLRRLGGQPIQDWHDLLQPCLKDRVAFVDAPREFIAAALKTLGAPVNATAQLLSQEGISEGQLRQRLDQLRSQVRLFSSSEHISALLAGDVAAAVGWSGELLPAAARSSNITLVAPASGTALWADVWAVPAYACGGSEGRGPSPLLPAWLEFSLQPQRAPAHRGLQYGAAPRLLPGGGPRGERPAAAEEALAQGVWPGGEQGGMLGGVMPSQDVLLRSEFLLPQDVDTVQLFWDALHPLWEQPSV